MKQKNKVTSIDDSCCVTHIGSTDTEADFERLSWHDNHIYGLHLALGDPDRDDWRSDLVSTSTISSNGSAASTSVSSFGSRRPPSPSTT